MTHTFSGAGVNQYCAHNSASKFKLSFLNQQKGKIDSRKYFMFNLHDTNIAELGFLLASTGSAVKRAAAALWGPAFFGELKTLWIFYIKLDLDV